MKLDERTTIPVTWFAAVMGAVVSCGGVSAFWVFTVNARLARIEEKLGITGPVSESVQKFVTPDEWVAMSEKTIKERRELK